MTRTLRSLALAALVSSTLAAPAHASTPQRYSMFGDRVRCTTDDAQTVCGSTQTWHVVVLWAGRSLDLGRVQPRTHHAYRPLSVGSHWQYGSNACAVLPSSVRCWSVRTQHGFTVDTSSRVRTF